MESIIDTNETCYIYRCETNEDLVVYVQPRFGGLTNIELFSKEEGCPVQQATESNPTDVFRTFDQYMKWMT